MYRNLPIFVSVLFNTFSDVNTNFLIEDKCLKVLKKYKKTQKQLQQLHGVSADLFNQLNEIDNYYSSVSYVQPPTYEEAAQQNHQQLHQQQQLQQQ